MKLYYSKTSPFARKVLMQLSFTQQIRHVELTLTDPFSDDNFRATNPLGKIPALVTPHKTLTDSSLICDYFDWVYTKSGHQSIFHRDTERYFDVQQVHMLANGILDAAVQTMMEKRRETEPSEYWLQRWRDSMHAAIETSDPTTLGNRSEVHIGTLAMVAALGYLDFRHPEYLWRDWNPALADWLQGLENEIWLKSTRPE